MQFFWGACFQCFCPLFFVTARNGYSITLRNSVQASSSKHWWLNSASLKANVILVAFILTNTRKLSVEIAQGLGKFICDFNRLQYYRLLKLSASANFSRQGFHWSNINRAWYNMRFIVNYVVYLFAPMFAFVNKCMHFLIFAPDSLFCLFAFFFCSFFVVVSCCLYFFFVVVVVDYKLWCFCFYVVGI